MRFITHGSIFLWAEPLSSIAARMDGMRADKFLAREIMMTGATLATMFD